MESSIAVVPSRMTWPRAARSLLPLFVFAAICLARVVYVSLYAAPLPFWDQWDELDRHIRPWFAGRWGPGLLFVPHGEHRIAFTRAISLLLASANGGVFDNLVEAFVNTGIYAGLWATLCALLVWRDDTIARPWLIALIIVAIGALPFDWENALIGFQNQFYLMELFAVVVIGVAAYRAASPGAVIWLVILALASLFTMGSGLLAAPAVCVALLIRSRRDPIHPKLTIFALAAMVLVTALGLVLLLHSKEQGALHAHRVSQIIAALMVCLIWPLQHPALRSHWLFVGMLWAPCIIWIVRYCKSRRGQPDELFAFALAAWVLLQCFAIAEARGHDMRLLPSRYSEIPAIGLVANLWLALKLLSAAKARQLRILGVALGCGAVLVGWVFWRRTPSDLNAMQQRHVFTTIETRNVRHYLGGQSWPTLPSGSLDLPYPSAARLRDLLANAEIRTLLPPAAFPPFDPRRPAPLSTLATSLQHFIRRLFPASVWTVNAETIAALTPSAFSPYAELPADAPTNQQCSLNLIDGKPAASVKPVAPGAAVAFGGWAADGHGEPTGKGLFILKGAQHTYAAPFTTGGNRPDVAKALGSSALATSGFNLTATLRDVATGTYALYIADPGSAATVCNLHRTLAVK